VTEWLNLDPTLTEEQNQKLTETVLGRLERHVHPQLARNLRLLHEEFIEWRAEGCYVYDPMGRPHFDAVGAGGVFALGHSHPQVTEAVRRQLDRGGLSVRTGLIPGQLELLERLSRLVPGQMPFGYIGSTGTEAMEAALKLARLTTGRPGLVGMQMGYHGMSVGDPLHQRRPLLARRLLAAAGTRPVAALRGSEGCSGRHRLDHRRRLPGAGPMGVGLLGGSGGIPPGPAPDPAMRPAPCSSSTRSSAAWGGPVVGSQPNTPGWSQT